MRRQTSPKAQPGTLRERERRSAVDIVAEALRQSIVDGSLAPGERLVEADLTARLNASRPTVRGALQQLAAAGLLTLQPFRGASVRRLTRTEVAELYEIREALEGLAAALAARNIDRPGHRAKFEKALKRSLGFRGRGDVPGYVRDNQDFHRLIIELAGNALLRHQAEQLATPIMRFQFRRLIEPDGIARSIAEHERIGRAILSGDPARAERAAREHICNSARFIAAYPDTAFEP